MASASPAPLPRFRDWPALLEELRESPLLEELRGADDQTLVRLLGGAASVAWWITHFAPEVLLRDTVRLLVVGLVGNPEVIDQGRPYALLPTLLGRPGLTVEASVMAIDIAPDMQAAHATAGVSLRAAPVAPVRIVPATMTEWHRGNRSGTADVCLLFHPNFECDVEVWRDVAALLRSHTVVGAFARGSEYLDRDLWLLEAYGYGLPNDVAPRANPFVSVRKDTSRSDAWGALAWKVPTHVAPSTDVPPDGARLARARAAQQFTRAEFVATNAFEFIGQVLHIAAGAGEAFIGLPDEHLVSRRTGRVFRSEDGALVPATGAVTLDAALLASYPDAARRQFDRFLWSVDVYLEHCRPAQTAYMVGAHARQVQELQAVLAIRLGGRSDGQDLKDVVDHYTGAIEITAITPGAEPLYRALRARNWQRAQKLIAAKPELVRARDEEGRTPLFHAFAARQLELADQWLRLGADPDQLDHEGFAVLHDVVKRVLLEPVELLHRHGADLNLATRLGFTPALIALQYGTWPVLAYLVQQGVDLRRENLLGTSVANQFQHVKELPGAVRQTIEGALGLPLSKVARRIPIAVQSGKG